MYASLLVGMLLLLAVNIELILRSLILLGRPDFEVPGDGMMEAMERAD